MMDMLPSIGWMIAGGTTLAFIVLLPFLLTPMLVLATLKFRLPIKVIPVDPRTEPLPRDVREYFHQAYQELAALNFQLVGTLYMPQVISNVKTLAALYVNRQTNDLAMSTFMVTTGEVEQLQAKYVEFHTLFTDGIKVQTNNSPELSAFKAIPGEYTTQFFDVKDASSLLRAHTYLKKKYRKAGEPYIKLDRQYQGNVTQYVVEHVFYETLDQQVETGYMRKTANAYTATIYGAAIMGWQELPPFKQLRKMKRRREAAAALAEMRGTQ